MKTSFERRAETIGTISSRYFLAKKHSIFQLSIEHIEWTIHFVANLLKYFDSSLQTVDTGIDSVQYRRPLYVGNYAMQQYGRVEVVMTAGDPRSGDTGAAGRRNSGVPREDSAAEAARTFGAAGS
jgi:hypothetical protein